VQINSGQKLLTVVILTKNEEHHLERLFRSFEGVRVEFCIIDSFSSDQTTTIAGRYGARVFQHVFINYATQFQWALDHCEITTPWVMRMDADEYLTPELADEINKRLPELAPDVGGVILKRQVHFMGRWIRFGGYYPVRLLRIWRNGIGRIEQRWMDEHIIIESGRTVEFTHDLVDANLNSLTWWTDKHNHYATREAIDLLNHKYGLIQELHKEGHAGGQMHRKRWVKENFYVRMPLFLRAFLYFIYRYVFRLGFLDGRRGLVWHVLQGFWYRFLVDAKIFQILWMAKTEGLSVREVIEQKFKMKLYH
jgi:glycosyltransferase involved in cell wall biosynthesis